MNNTRKIIIFCAFLCALGMMTACKSGTSDETKMDFQMVKEFIPAEGIDYYADSVDGYATFSAEDNIIVIPEEITKDKYNKLLTDKFTLRRVAIDTNSSRYAELYKMGLQNALRYDSIREFGEFEVDE